MFRGEKPKQTKLAPQWTLERIARHAIDFWLSTEDLPRPENRVTVDGDGKLTLAYTATNDTPKKELYKQLHSMLAKLRMEPDNRVTVNGDGNIVLTYTETNAETKKRLYVKVKSLLGKMLVSTTYRLSSSCARQSRFSTESAGSLPKRQVPAWWATPATGMSFFI
jgi:hypothetical protein